MKYLFKNSKAIAKLNEYRKCTYKESNLNSGNRVVKLRQLQLGILSLIGVASVLVLPNSARAATDFGDAPASYGTLSANNGASHTITGLYLGAGVSAETDGQPNATATGDTNDDGITFNPTLGANYSTLVQAGISNQLTVVSSGAGFVNAWIDYNKNGVFDSGELILSNQAVAAGTNTLTFTPDNRQLHGSTFARFRLSPTSITSPSPVGLIVGGEVEDYQVYVAAPVPDGAACATTGLLNGGFENPVQSASTYNIYSKSFIPGWNTNASDQKIEVWSTPYNGVTAYAGNQFAEMNANMVAALYQDIATVPGSTITYQFAHRARSPSGPVLVDTASFKAGPPGALVNLIDLSSDSTDWIVYRGTYVVPAGQYITRVQFDSIASGFGKTAAGAGNNAVGNFLDGVQFSTNNCVTPISPPTIDLDGNNSTAIGNNYQNTFVIGGSAVAAADTDTVITDDKTNITRAIFTLTNTPDGANESLTIDPTAGGTVTGVSVDSAYDSTAGSSTTGRLTLKGSATLSDYQKVIATLKYSNTKASPTTSDRTINVQVIDSDKAISNTATSTIKIAAVDFGDAPASYGTLLADDGARHTISGLYLGAGVTADTNGQPNATATGDANDDGITFSPTLGANYSTLVQAGISNQIKVVSSGSGYVNAWIDYNKNGVFDSGEQILTNQAVVAGTNTLTFTPDNRQLHGSTFARFRLSPTSIASPSPLGLIVGGEVEDYQVYVAAPVPDGAACATTGLLNGGFENPTQSANSFYQWDKNFVPGWNTNATDQKIEIWSTPFQGVTAYLGNQFAEINANQVATLFQDIATVPGSTLTYQFAHRARRLPTTGPDVVDVTGVNIGAPGATVQQSIYSTDSTDWVVYRGTYLVPAGQYITRFEFASLSAGSGSPSVGNFIDDVRFSLNGCVTPFSPPTIDLDGNNSTATGNNYQNTFLVGGAAVAAADTDVVITDDKTNITRAIIQLTTTPDGTNESLTIDPTAGGTVTGVTVDLPYDSTGTSTKGRLTLKGSATLSDYQKVLTTLKYSNTKASPTMSDRTINVQVIDSDKAISNTATSTIKMVVGKSISGTLYRDNDRSGTNNSEPGIGSIRVILYKDNDNNDEVDSTSEIIQQVNTLADGTYQFPNVAPGTYKIKVDIADTDVPLGYTLGTTDNLPVTVNTTNITGQDFGFYPALTCEWDAQLYTGHFPVAGQGGTDSVANGYYGPTGLPTLRGTAKFGTGIAKFTFNDQTIDVNPPVHPLRTIINGSFPSQGYVPINGNYPLRTYANTDDPNWAIVFKRQALAKGRVTLGQTGAYIDDAMEIYLNGVRVGNPVLTYTTSLAANQVSTVSVNAGDIIEIRLTNFGYIGGFVVSTDFAYDFGDAPNSYGEVSHAPSCSNPHLGATSTGENNQSYSANADGDTGDDGVTLPSSLTPGTTATITVNASTAGFLNSWIDFNKNGVFDSGEQLNLTNVTKGTAATVNNVPLNAGNNTLTFTVPSNATVGSSFARFRFTATTVATPSPTGSGDAGEVEDYAVTLANPVNISGTVFSDADADVTINGSDAGTNAGSANLTIYAIDTAGKVLDKATVAANGTYSLSNVPVNSSVTLRLSNDSTVAIGATAPTASSIPSGWYYTGENKNGTIDGTIATLGNIALTTTTSNLTNENFGIRQAYTITADPAPTTCNPDYSTALNTGITAAGGQLAVGANDLNWTAEWIAGPASGPGTPYAPPRPVGPMPAVVIGNLAPYAWVNEPANARWISYPFRLSVNSNGNHNNADLDGNYGEGNPSFSGPGTSDDVRLKFTSQLTLPSNANTVSISLPVGVAIDNQFVSIKVNGVENLVPTPAANPTAAEYGSLKTVNITNGWQAGVNTIEVIVDSGPDLVGFLLGVQATSTQVCGKSNVVLVKRITAINGVKTINPSDNTTHLDQVLDNPATPNDDATVKWPSGYLVGAFNAGKIKPGDVLEYTVYFLNAKGANANTVKICDRIIGSQTYKTSSLEIRLGNATSSISLSDAADPTLDRGQFYPSSASAPAACNLITPGTGVTDNGTWAVDVTGTGSSAQPDFTTMPSATAPGTPTASYGFIRFKTIVNP